MIKKTIILSLLICSIGCIGPNSNNTERGAVHGAAIGAILGAIIGHQTGSGGEGAAIGAAGGAILGGAAGNDLDRKEGKK